FFSSRRRHTRFKCDWSSDVCSSDLVTKSPERRQLRVAGEFGVLGHEHGRLLRDHHENVEGESARGILGKELAVGAGEIKCAERRSEERRVGKEGRGGGWEWR